MQLLIPPEITEKLIADLAKAGSREIGGILMGEHLAEGMFRLKDLTLQRRGGSFAYFTRVVRDIVDPLRKFFRATNYDYTRFNYLGEWHSHPSFIPEPSHTDHATMRDILSDPIVGANFVVLLIVKLGPHHTLEGSVTVYEHGHRECRGTLILENEHDQTE